MKNKSAEDIESLRTQLLQKLQGGDVHSAASLASEFAISCSAISRHIKALNELGLDICSVSGSGYKLSTDIELLSPSDIIASLPAGSKANAALIQIENLVGSTNDIVKIKSKSTPAPESGYCCLAEAQSSGRGRRGRAWVSPYGGSLYLSMLWRFANGYQAMAGLSLMVGVVVNDTLQSLGVQNCQLKWPNDIYFDQQKLAGILIEVEGQIGGSTSAIIGIGININLPKNIQGIDQAFTDLHSISTNAISRNELASLLIHNLWQALPVFETQGMLPFMSRWQAADLYYQKPITLISGEKSGEKSIVGIGKGINESGALLLDINGKTEAFHGGEISVRQA